MRIKFLGTGSAFTLKNYQSNLAIERNGKWLLLDAGGDIRFSLRDAFINDEKAMPPLSYKDIDAIYISHLHADHGGGMEYFGFCSYFDPNKKRIKLFGSGELLRRGWEDSWKGGLESIQGRLLSLEDFFEVKPVRPNSSFMWEDLEFDIVQSIHIMNGYAIVPCYGLMIRSNKKVIYWTSDVQFCPLQILDFYKEADIIIQDCETSSFKSGVHANFSDLIDLPKEVKDKMWLTHYQDNVMDNNGLISFEWAKKAQDAGFKGFAEKGQELIIEGNS